MTARARASAGALALLAASAALASVTTFLPDAAATSLRPCTSNDLGIGGPYQLVVMQSVYSRAGTKYLNVSVREVDWSFAGFDPVSGEGSCGFTEQTTDPNATSTGTVCGSPCHNVTYGQVAYLQAYLGQPGKPSMSTVFPVNNGTQMRVLQSGGGSDYFNSGQRMSWYAEFSIPAATPAYDRGALYVTTPYQGIGKTLPMDSRVFSTGTGAQSFSATEAPVFPIGSVAVVVALALAGIVVLGLFKHLTSPTGTPRRPR